MARVDGDEPSLSAAEFERRCQGLAVEFGTAIGLPRGEVAFSPFITSTTAEMSLVGRATERVSRNRGQPHQVVPIASVSAEVDVWAGYREVWQRQVAEQKFRFVEGGFTLHLGARGDLAKPQVLRSEWVGRRSRAFVEQAGHPHWQVDALESVRSASASPRPQFEPLATEPAVEEFGGQDHAGGPSALCSFTIEDMHLASSAQWWNATEARLAHAPQSVSALDQWILRSIAYLRQEVGRCRLAA